MLVTRPSEAEVWRQRAEELRKPRARRSLLDLYASILKASMPDAITANGLILHLNLNSRLTKKYLAGLLQQGFIEVRREGRFATYSATEEGKEWFGLYLKVVKEITPRTQLLE